MSTLVYSGSPVVGPQSLTFKSTGLTVDYYLAYDLKQVCDAFLSKLGVDSVASRILPAMVSNRDIMIEVVGSQGGPQATSATITVHFHILKLRTALDSGSAIGAESATYTVNSLINLLEANNHFDNLGGLSGIATWSYVSGLAYIPPVNIREEHQDQFDGALVEVTFNYLNSPVKQTL